MKIFSFITTLLATGVIVLADQPTLASQLSTCIDEELKKEWGRPHKDNTTTPLGWYPFTHICPNQNLNLTFIILPYSQDGDPTNNGRITKYSTLYTAKSCLIATKPQLIQQATYGLPRGKAFDLKGQRKDDDEEASVECMVVYDSTGEVRKIINKPDPWVGGWFENPDVPAWTSAVGKV